MDLDFTPEQDMLREAVAGVCARHASLDVVRQMENDPIGYPDKLWEQLAELGLLGMTLPEELGGSGMSMLDAVVVYTELGRSLAPSPHFVSSVMSAGVLARAGIRTRSASDWLPAIAAGEAIVTPAWLEPGRGFGPGGRAAPRERRRRRLAARRRPSATCSSPAAADRLLVLARTPDGPALLPRRPEGERA